MHWVIGILGYSLFLYAFFTLVFSKNLKHFSLLSTLLMFLTGNLFIFTHELNTEQRMRIEQTVNDLSTRVALEGEANEQNIDIFHEKIERIGINKKDIVAFTYPKGTQDFKDIFSVKAEIKMQPDTVFTYIANWLFEYKATITVESRNVVQHYQ